MSAAILKTSFFLSFFFLFYVESLDIGGIKLAVIWKALLMAALVTYLIARIDVERFPRLLAWGGVFVVMAALNASLWIDPALTLSEALKNSYIPIIVIAGLSFASSQRRVKALWQGLTMGAQFVVWSAIPFLIGVLEPLGDGYNLELFGADGSGYVGIFQNAHAAAISVATASVILFARYLEATKRGARYWLLASLILGLFVLYSTYVRTGYVMALAGLAAVYFRNAGSGRTAWRFLFVFCGIGIGIWAAFEYSEAFRMRLAGSNVFLEQSGWDPGLIGSGRLEFWKAALRNVFSQDIGMLLFGMGPSVAHELMYQQVGMRISAHNGFLDILQYHGIVGLVIFSLFFCELYRLGTWRPGNPSSALSWGLLVVYLVQMTVQGERVFLADALLSIAIVCAYRVSKALKGEAVCYSIDEGIVYGTRSK